MRRVRQSELDEAVEVLNQAYDVCRESGMNAWVGPILPWLATTHRLQCERSTDLAPHHRRQLFKRARRAVRQALAVARKFQPDLPHALREAGLVAAMQGSARRARKCFGKSLEVAERQGAKFEYAQSLLARGRVGLTLGWPGAAEDVAAGREALFKMGAEFATAQLAVPE